MNILHKYTLQSLKQSRTRTIVTIMGIILSVAMITAVTTTVSSLQDFMLRTVEKDEGGWYASLEQVTKEDEKRITNQEEVERFGTFWNIGND